MDRLRFRTPRTPTRLREMYDDAIEIPVQRGNLGADARAPLAISIGASSSEPGVSNSRARQRDGSTVHQQTSQRAGIWYHHAHLITDIGHREYRVKASDELGAATSDYDVPKLAAMFPIYTAACVRFAEEEDVEPEGFIACAVYALCEPPYAAQRHNVYKRLAFECFYQTCTEFPQFLYDAIQGTWSYPGEVFTGFIPTHRAPVVSTTLDDCIG